MSLNLSTVFCRKATVEDAEQIFNVVNQDYSIEKGNTGLAFKSTDRYQCKYEVINDINKHTV